VVPDPSLPWSASDFRGGVENLLASSSISTQSGCSTPRRVAA